MTQPQAPEMAFECNTQSALGNALSPSHLLPETTLPRIIWVAARPPIPPFSGITSKTLCGLDALLSMTEVDLITFTAGSSTERTLVEIQRFWGDRSVRIHALRLEPRSSGLSALLRGQFQLTTEFDRNKLAAKLEELNWSERNNLVIFDDIVLAPLAQAYGTNAIISPHDCMSEMFLSHFRHLHPLSASRLRKYIQYRTARQYEQRYYQSALLVHVITQRDRVWLEAINPLARYHVVPNADLLNPGLVYDSNPEHDLLIWGDLTIAACAKGTREFLRQIRGATHLNRARIILVGKVPDDTAERIIGRDCMELVDYSPRLENEAGQMHTAKIFVIPDIGGAGIKNRVVNVLSSGICLACLLPQMEGVDTIADRGAINAVTMSELVNRIVDVLRTGQYSNIAKIGENIYKDVYSIEANRRQWRDMIERALSIRSANHDQEAL
jgi:hypothetical protein